jgi:tRNA nucleotidyltransferase (CCA-adding enzyme)
MIPDSKPLEKEVLKKITPDLKENNQLKKVIRNLKNRVKKEIEKTTIPITLELVGSTAKDTYIKNAVDIDLFLVFPVTTPREVLQEKGLSIGRAILEHQEECFAEHPYVRGVFQGYKTELVPCYKIDSASQKLSAVDRTPLHTKYVKKHIKESQKKEVRLFKQFLKGIGCYGAEAEIEGFSGYLCELLIMKYGTFQQLIENAQQLRHGQILAFEEGSYPLFETPLIFIDPVDPNRNVASALSEEKFTLFRTACHAYRLRPRLTFFFPNPIKPWSLEKIRKKMNTSEYIGVQLHKPKIIAENLYPQIRKAIRAITELCEQNDFTIRTAMFSVDETSIYIILQTETLTLSKTILHEGPPVTLKKNAEEFLEKWMTHPRTRKKPFEKNKRLYVEINREYTSIKSLLQDQIKNLSLGKHIDQAIKKGYTILIGNDLLIDTLRLFWTTFLDVRLPWDR